jgi:hypothetical protein
MALMETSFQVASGSLQSEKLGQRRAVIKGLSFQAA